MYPSTPATTGSVGVLRTVRSGLINGAAIAIRATHEISVTVMLLPMVNDRSFQLFEPKNCDAMIVAPVEIPMKSTSSILSMGIELPTAERALSRIYFPTTILST